MEKDRTIPFPQADDFTKIIRILNISNPYDIKNLKAMKVILGGITDRQVQYYITALMYLGLIDINKDFTALGNDIRNQNEYEQNISLGRLIITDSIFGEVYFSERILGCKLEREDIVFIMKKQLLFGSEEMYKRRAQTVLKWVEWINSICV